MHRYLICCFLLLVITTGCSTNKPAPKQPPTILETSASIFGLMGDFVESPAVEKYLAMIDLISSDLKKGYIDNGDILHQAEELLNKKQFAESIKLLDSPEGLHSIIIPRYHLILAANYRALNRTEEADAERSIFSLLLVAISKSGDGSQAKPYRVLHVESQYDFMKYWLKIERSERRQQSLMHVDGRSYDMHELTSGRTIWFDITERMSILRANISDTGKQ